MSTTLHTIVSLSTLVTINYLVYFKPTNLIGFIFGPSTQLEAEEQHQSISTILQKDTSYCDIYDTAYSDSSVIRDAGLIASLFTLILILFPGLTSFEYTKRQCLCFLVLLPFLWMTPGLMGQILNAQIPVELSFLKTHGKHAFRMIEYCSFHSLASGGRGLSTVLEAVLYEAKLVVLAGGMLFLVLGVMPRKE